MIDEEKTFREKGYRSTDLKPRSHKPVWAICEGEDCGYGRWVEFRQYRDLCFVCAKKKSRKYSYDGIDNICKNIDEEKTFREKGYRSSELSAQSHKEVWAVCNGCGEGRWTEFKQYSDLCKKCACRTDENINRLISLNIGRTHSDLHNEKISESCKGLNSGEDHYRWKGGITPERHKFYVSREYTKWRNSVFERDNYTCQECGDSTGGNLQAHHILPLRDYSDPEYSLNVDNGITLCEECHDKVNGREYEFVERYQKIVRSKSYG